MSGRKLRKKATTRTADHAGSGMDSTQNIAHTRSTGRRGKNSGDSNPTLTAILTPAQKAARTRAANRAAREHIADAVLPNAVDDVPAMARKRPETGSETSAPSTDMPAAKRVRNDRRPPRTAIRDNPEHDAAQEVMDRMALHPPSQPSDTEDEDNHSQKTDGEESETELEEDPVTDLMGQSGRRNLRRQLALEEISWASDKHHAVLQPVIALQSRSADLAVPSPSHSPASSNRTPSLSSSSSQTPELPFTHFIDPVLLEQSESGASSPAPNSSSSCISQASTRRPSANIRASARAASATPQVAHMAGTSLLPPRSVSMPSAASISSAPPPVTSTFVSSTSAAVAVTSPGPGVVAVDRVRFSAESQTFNAGWPDCTWIEVPKKGKTILITAQPQHIHKLLNDATYYTHLFMCFHDAFPDHDARAELLQRAVKAAVEKLQASVRDPFLHRLEAQPTFAEYMMSSPLGRIGILRSDIKQSCEAAVVGHYGLVSGCMERVMAELDKDKYIYARSPTNARLKDRPFQHPCIIDQLRTHFFAHSPRKGRPLTQRFNDNFISSVTWDARKEIPAPMLALIATAIYAAIREWETGECVTEDFTADTYMDVYSSHMLTLADIKQASERAYHGMMAGLYEAAS
ncbi:hypothetical protein PUNSTDRAFT_129113 [Punctularia strigosozonata HHB-11173 SS5]|uniref:uncharacterized protein n=1 Tax=Punctularia strigosozonata (strain HHB-11173) TaxID=741275 RepID=UPI000441783D|nr:uncharacterized protein PUNSTDRAFT_129113 [Punctularia strigosozonata HHB-11173 SS5]EIN13428.1 hypothetical protein PUNSTDRAFT_129113 [Punctularia strigosozonata HHB-11173 SS5]